MPGAVLVPYDDSMRLGQGYNSFLQKPCVLNAVTFGKNKVETTSGNGSGAVSQVVNYSSRFVNKISEVAKSMNISAGSSIKNGGVGGSGSSVTLDEEKFAASDLNAVVSVKVINQTTEITGDVDFTEIKGMTFDSKSFFATYGNCYISGFLEGGEMTGVVSAKVLDTENKAEIKKAIKSQVNSSGNLKDFILSEDSSFSNSNSTMSQTETTITVSWSGGGQIKPEQDPWTLESLYSVAAAFPSNVSKCPQKTWAILSPYTQSMQFVKFAHDNKIIVPQFEGAMIYANDLLDMYMEYKSCVGRIQRVLARPLDYVEADFENAIGTSVTKLLEARTSLKEQIKKITQAVDELAETPDRIGEIESKAHIMQPEEWTHRIPVLKSSTPVGPEWTPEKLVETLGNFSFAPPEEVHKPATNPPTEILTHPYAPDNGCHLRDSEKKMFEDIGFQVKFKQFWFSKPIGESNPSGTGKFFNQADDIVKLDLKHQTPAGCTRVQMKDTNGNMLIGHIARYFEGLTAQQGTPVSQTTPDNNLMIDGPIIEVIMTASTTGINYIKFIKASKSERYCWTLGRARAGVQVRCKKPEGTTGLVGFYGIMGDEIIERIGCIWV